MNRQNQIKRTPSSTSSINYTNQLLYDNTVVNRSDLGRSRCLHRVRSELSQQIPVQSVRLD